MYCAKIIIPKVSDTYNLYVYCSKHPDDINTIEKIRTIQPTVIIDESMAETQDVNGRPCYVIYDSNLAEPQPGVSRVAAPLNLVPTTEYETSVNVVPVNNFTYVNQVEITDLPIKYNGTMLYYSVIGVDDVLGVITHISKVNGVMIDSNFQSDGTRQLYSCDNYTGEKTDTWNYVGSIAWNEEIKIGDVNDIAQIARFGLPMVETVPMFDSENITCQTKTVPVNNFMTLEIPNPWQRNNKEFNFRKMKSYKLRNVCDEQYGEFSEPSYQSLLPVSIEKMIILKQTDPDEPNEPLPIERSFEEGFDMYQVIRKGGVYYDTQQHRKLGLNKYSIPLEESTGIFSEASTQDKINIQIEALAGHTYAYTIYLIDVYGHHSVPAHFVVRT